jgi:LacI family transcriptional regulator
MPVKKTTAEKSFAARRVRMIDVAREAGVSQPTVSYVLHGGKKAEQISAKTAAKIRRIAARLKFHPNHAARQLAGKRSGVIGALAKTWSHATESRTLGWLNQLAPARSFKILAWQMDGQPGSLDRAVNECLGWGIDGLIFVAFKYDSVWPEVASAVENLPRVVSLMGNPGIPGGATVEIDAADGVWQSVEHLHRQGRKRIVQVLEGLDTQMDRQRHAAFLAAHRHFYGPPDDDQVCFATAGWGPEDYDKYLELAKELIGPRGADAILADSDFSAPPLVRGVGRLGRRIPDDVALVGWGYEVIGRGVNPGLTTVDFNFEQIVGSALDLLVRSVENGDEGKPESILIKPTLIVKETA